jgi:hypothetical protein
LAADTKVLEAPAALAAHKKSGTSGPIWQREQLLVSSIAACDDAGTAFVELNLLLSALALTHSLTWAHKKKWAPLQSSMAGESAPRKKQPLTWRARIISGKSLHSAMPGVLINKHCFLVLLRVIIFGLSLPFAFLHHVFDIFIKRKLMLFNCARLIWYDSIFYGALKLDITIVKEGLAIQCSMIDFAQSWTVHVEKSNWMPLCLFCQDLPWLASFNTEEHNTLLKKQQLKLFFIKNLYCLWERLFFNLHFVHSQAFEESKQHNCCWRFSTLVTFLKNYGFAFILFDEGKFCNPARAYKKN